MNFKQEKLTCVCGARFNKYNWDGTREYTKCFDCWNEVLPNTTEPYASQKDAEESEDINF